MSEINQATFDGSELRHGCVQRLKRWSGDTHDDLGGSVDEVATDALMSAAADAIDRLTAERDEAKRASRCLQELLDETLDAMQRIEDERDNLLAEIRERE